MQQKHRNENKVETKTVCQNQIVRIFNEWVLGTTYDGVISEITKYLKI